MICLRHTFQMLKNASIEEVIHFIPKIFLILTLKLDQKYMLVKIFLWQIQRREGSENLNIACLKPLSWLCNVVYHRNCMSLHINCSVRELLDTTLSHPTQISFCLNILNAILLHSILGNAIQVRELGSCWSNMIQFKDHKVDHGERYL